jgi:hypothetical protein
MIPEHNDHVCASKNSKESMELKVKKLHEKSLKIKDAGGNDIGCKGTFLVPMQVLGRKVMHDLVVLENVKDQILGIDFIRNRKMLLGDTSN